MDNENVWMTEDEEDRVRAVTTALFPKIELGDTVCLVEGRAEGEGLPPRHDGAYGVVEHVEGRLLWVNFDATTAPGSHRNWLVSASAVSLIGKRRRPS